MCPNLKKEKKRKEKELRKKKGKEDKGRKKKESKGQRATFWAEKEKKEKKSFSLLSKIYGNRVDSFHQSQKKS